MIFSPVVPAVPAEPGTRGRLYVVGVPIGHPDDLTVRAIHVLQTVSLIASEDPRETQALLEHHRTTGVITSYHRENRDEKTAILLDRLLAGHAVALVSDSGTPAVYDPGAFLVRTALEHGVDVVPVPGPSAATAALSVSGMNGDQVMFVGHLSPRPSVRRATIKRLSLVRGTLVLFLDSPQRTRMLRDLYECLGPRTLCVSQNLTRAGESVHRTTLEMLVNSPRRWNNADLLTLVIEGSGTRRGDRKGGRRPVRGGDGRQPTSSRRRINTR